MPGSAGSKYGVIYDAIPLRTGIDGKEAGIASKDALQNEPELKNLRSLIQARLKRKQPAQTKP